MKLESSPDESYADFGDTQDLEASPCSGEASVKADSAAVRPRSRKSSSKSCDSAPGSRLKRKRRVDESPRSGDTCAPPGGFSTPDVEELVRAWKRFKDAAYEVASLSCDFYGRRKLVHPSLIEPVEDIADRAANYVARLEMMQKPRFFCLRKMIASSIGASPAIAGSRLGLRSSMLT